MKYYTNDKEVRILDTDEDACHRFFLGKDKTIFNESAEYVTRRNILKEGNFSEVSLTDTQKLLKDYDVILDIKSFIVKRILKAKSYNYNIPYEDDTEAYVLAKVEFECGKISNIIASNFDDGLEAGKIYYENLTNRFESLKRIGGASYTIRDLYKDASWDLNNL